MLNKFKLVCSIYFVGQLAAPSVHAFPRFFFFSSFFPTNFSYCLTPMFDFPGELSSMFAVYFFLIRSSLSVILIRWFLTFLTFVPNPL